MRRRAVPLVLAAACAFGACGGGSNGTPKAGPAPDTIAPATTTTARQSAAHLYIPAGPNPSNSAKMICEPEARADIASALGVKETSVTSPTWRDHVYSCTYVYPQGKVGIAVKELVDATTTSAYYDAILQKFGVIRRLPGLGQGAWLLRNDDVAVRKDYKVLLVDVQRIPPKFTATMGRSDVALNVAAVIMGCWSGA